MRFFISVRIRLFRAVHAFLSQVMLTEIYIEALLVDEQLADQVWELWNRGIIGDELATVGWFLLVAAIEFGVFEDMLASIREEV